MIHSKEINSFGWLIIFTELWMVIVLKLKDSKKYTLNVVIC